MRPISNKEIYTLNFREEDGLSDYKEKYQECLNEVERLYPNLHHLTVKEYKYVLELEKEDIEKAKNELVKLSTKNILTQTSKLYAKYYVENIEFCDMLSEMYIFMSEYIYKFKKLPSNFPSFITAFQKVSFYAFSSIHRKRKSHNYDMNFKNEGLNLDEIPSTMFSPDEELIRKQNMTYIKKMISMLKKDQKETVEDYFGIDCDKKSYIQMSKKYNITFQAVTNRVHSAFNKLLTTKDADVAAFLTDVCLEDKI